MNNDELSIKQSRMKSKRAERKNEDGRNEYRDFVGKTNPSEE